MKQGYLIDLDGVIYRGTEAVPGAREFVAHLDDTHTPHLFFTNNSTCAPLDVVAKLKNFGIPTTTDHVFTSAMATAQFVARQKPRGSAFVIGEGGLLEALQQAGYTVGPNAADYVVVGEGGTTNLEVLERAQRLIEGGAKLVSTQADLRRPANAGLPPDCVEIVSRLEIATSRTAYHVGNPNPFMMRLARRRIGLRAEEVTLIGDSMPTDIRGATDLGFRSVLVLTGSTRVADLENYPYQPTIVADSIADLLPEAALAVA